MRWSEKSNVFTVQNWWDPNNIASWDRGLQTRNFDSSFSFLAKWRQTEMVLKYIWTWSIWWSENFKKLKVLTVAYDTLLRLSLSRTHYDRKPARFWAKYENLIKWSFWTKLLDFWIGKQDPPPGGSGGSDDLPGGAHSWRYQKYIKFCLKILSNTSTLSTISDIVMSPLFEFRAKYGCFEKVSAKKIGTTQRKIKEWFESGNVYILRWYQWFWSKNSFPRIRVMSLSQIMSPLNRLFGGDRN